MSEVIGSLARAKHWLVRSQLRRNTFWVFGAQGVRLTIQALYFVIIARKLGVHEYGQFVSAVALIGIAAPFADLGTGNVLVKNVARRRELLPQCFWNAILVTLILAAAMLVLGIGVARWFLPAVPLLTVALVGAADLLLSRWIDICGQAFQAVEDLRSTAKVYVAQSSFRIAGAAVLLILPFHGDSTLWSALYLAATGIAAVFAMTVVWRSVGGFRPQLHLLKGEMVEGVHFSISVSAQSIYNNIDKALLARMATASVAGFYAAAYRIVEMAFLPIASLLAASYARYFRAGEAGLRGTVHQSAKFLPSAVLYCTAIAVAMFMSAPVLPFLLGHGFDPSVTVLRYLSILPVLKAFSYFAANALTGAGHQDMRSWVQVAVAVFNTVLTVWWIRIASWRGAVWASLVSDAVLAVALWAVIGVLMQHSRKTLGAAAHV